MLPRSLFTKRLCHLGVNVSKHFLTPSAAAPGPDGFSKGGEQILEDCEGVWENPGGLCGVWVYDLSSHTWRPKKAHWPLHFIFWLLAVMKITVCSKMSVQRHTCFTQASGILSFLVRGRISLYMVDEFFYRIKSNPRKFTIKSFFLSLLPDIHTHRYILSINLLIYLLTYLSCFYSFFFFRQILIV